MADLGNLWFSLGLDDSKFEKQWQKAFAKYESKAEINVKFKIDSKSISELAKFKHAGITGKEAKEYAKLATAVMQVAREQEKLNREKMRTKALDEQLSASAKKTTKSYNDQALWLQNLKSLAANYFSLYAVKNFVTELSMVSGEFEKQRKTLQAMVGEMQGLDIYGKMKELAVVSPFEFKDLASYAKQLAAFSVPYEELYDTTKRLADVSTGLGVDMSRIILAYGQIKSAGVLRGTELRQLTEAGVPILDKLAQKFEELEGRAVSVGDVFGKISKKLVSFEMVKEVFTDLTSEGGQFYKMQEIQAETLAGKISNLKDAYSIMLSEIGESNDGFLKGGVEWLYKFINNWEAVGRVIISVATAYGVYQAAQMAAFSADKLKLIGTFVSKMIEFNGSIRQAAASMAALNMATKAGVWGAFLGALVGIGAALISAYRASNKFNRELDEIFSRQTTELEKETRAFNELKEAIDNATEGSHNRREAIKQFNNQFGSYLDNLLTEKSAAEDLALAYNNVSNALLNKNKQEAKTKAMSLVEEEYGTEVNNTIRDLMSDLKKGGLSSKEAEDIIILLQEYYKQGGAKLKDINKIITDRIGEDAFKKANLGVSNALTRKLKTTLREQVVAYEEAMKKIKEEDDARWSDSAFSTKGEADLQERVNNLYERRIELLKQQKNLTQEEYEKKLRDIEILKAQELAEGYGQLGLPEIAKTYIQQWEKLAQVAEGWRKDIADIFASFNDEKKNIKLPTIFNPREGEIWSDYVERLQKEYKELKDDIDNIGADPEGDLPLLEAEMAAMKAVAKEYKIILDAKKDAKDAKEAEKDRVNALKDEYNWLLKVYDAYKKYRDQELSDKDAKQNVLADFADMPNSLKTSFGKDSNIKQWFNTQMQALAAEASKGGSDIGTALASAILQKLGVIISKEQLDILRLEQQLKDEMEKWGLEDFALQGEGITLDISKILRDQAVEENKIFAQRKEKLDKIAKLERENSEKNYNAEKSEIERLTRLQLDNNEKVARKKISDLAKGLAKEDLDKTLPMGFISNLGDKSLSQLKKAQDKLQGLLVKEPDFLFDAEFLDKLAAAEVDLDAFVKTYKEYISLQLNDVSSEIWQNNRDKIVTLGQSLSTTLAAISEFASISGKKPLSNFISGLKETLDVAIKVGEALDFDSETGKLKLNAKDTIALIAQIGVSIFNYFGESKRQLEATENSFVSFANAIRLAKTEALALEAEIDTIFGKNAIRGLQSWGDQITEVWNNITKSIREAGSINLSAGRYDDDVWGYHYSKEASKALGDRIKEMTYLEKKSRFLFWDTSRYTKLGDPRFAELFNEDGGLNFEYLDEFLEKAENLDDAQKEFFQNLLDNYNLYKEALENINDYLEGIFSDTASTIADRMIESFAATGDAATELGDLVHNVAKSMAKDLIQSLLIDQYLQPAMQRVKNLYNPESDEYEEDAELRVQKSIMALQNGLQAAEGGAEEVNKILQGLANMGIDFSGEAENASQVLSGLTEDQQNLLLSYINGIRADVSVNKGLLTSIVTSVGSINNNLATAIIVWTQIEANTHRSADGVDKLIGFFESVMGPYDGGAGQAFQVNIA